MEIRNKIRIFVGELTSNGCIMAIKEFMDYLRYERGRSEHTIDSYRRDLEAFEAYFTSLDAGLTFETLDSDVIRDWMESMMDNGNTATSVNRRLSAVRSFYRFALSHGKVEHDPAHAVAGPKKRRPLPQYVREDEMSRLLDGQHWGDDYISTRTRTILLVFYETGVRVSELTGLDDSSVDFARSEIRVTGKGSKQRAIPFGAELEAVLKSYIRQRDMEIAHRSSPALFLTEKGERVSADTVRKMVKEQLSQVCNLKKRSPHVLRHTFATAMLNGGADIESVRKLLGHERLSTTEIYTHTTFEQLRAAYKKAHPRE